MLTIFIRLHFRPLALGKDYPTKFQFETLFYRARHRTCNYYYYYCFLFEPLDPHCDVPLSEILLTPLKLILLT